MDTRQSFVNEILLRYTSTSFNKTYLSQLLHLPSLFISDRVAEHIIEEGLGKAVQFL